MKNQYSSSPKTSRAQSDYGCVRSASRSGSATQEVTKNSGNIANFQVLRLGLRPQPRSATLVFLWCLALGVWMFSHATIAAETNSLLSAWLNAQKNLQTWSADFVQTRTFKSLTQPLTATGHVSFAEPNRFHWELGQPAQTIAIRATNDMLIIYPKLKRVERYSLSGNAAGPWRDALALLEAGFPRSQADLESHFRILSQQITNGACEVALQPKSSAARKMMPQIKIAFDTGNFSLRATELQFADGSTMRNDFTNSVLNPKLEEELFAPKIPSDFKIVEPLKQK